MTLIINFLAFVVLGGYLGYIGIFIPDPKFIIIMLIASIIQISAFNTKF